MLKTIPTSVMDYRELKLNDFYVVDKSMMIKTFLDNKNNVTLITRPRRFGKTLNMSMMAEFFDITKDSKDIFKDTKIVETQYITHMNKYPTIFLSFANAKNNIADTVVNIKSGIYELYQKHQEVISHMDKGYIPIYQYLMNKLNDYNDLSFNGLGKALSFLIEQMERYYHKKVMLFIDEYDTPFIEAYTGGFYQEIKGGLASILSNALKGTNSLQYAMLSGIQRVANENIFSDLNNFYVCSVRQQDYSEFFGFDEEETKALLEYYGLELTDDVKEMYDGYHIGNNNVYNPWSILHYAKEKSLEAYWVNTSSNKMISLAMEQCDDIFKDQYETLLMKGSLTTQVRLETSFYEKSSTPCLWGMFVNAGYLTIAETISSRHREFKLVIPNQEVADEYIALTEYYLGLRESDLSDFAKYLVREQKVEFISRYQDILKLPSYHDLENKNSYHMMLLCFCVCISSDYEVISNREAGYGRCDLILKAKHKNKASFVLEFKYSKKAINLEVLANEAINQISDKHYDQDLVGRIIYIGLAHHGKEVAMKWIEK